MDEKRRAPVPESVKTTTEEWGRKAHQDLVDARQLFGTGSLYNAAYLAQQCAEKALKAILIVHQREYPFTHVVAKILGPISEFDRSLADEFRLANRLSEYAVATRYPFGRPLGQEEVLGAIHLAEDVYAKVKAYVAKFGVNWP